MKRIKYFFQYKEYRMIIIFTVMITFFFTMIIYSFYNFHMMLKESILRSYIYKTAENAEFTKREVDNFKRRIEEVATRSVIQSMACESSEHLLMSEYERLEIEWIQIANLNGYARCSNGNEGYIGNQEYFKKAINGLTVLTDPLLSSFDEQEYIICATPIYDSNEHIIGVLVAGLAPDFLFRIVGSQRIGRTGYGFIVNNQGEIIVHSLNESVFTQNNLLSDKLEDSLESTTIINKICYGEIGHYFILNRNVKKLMTFAPILDTEWSLVMTVPADEIFYELDAIKHRFYMLLIVLLTVSILFNFILYRYTVQHKKMEWIQQESDRQAKQLKESIEMDLLKTEFIANVSHELRTPVNVILSTIQLLDLNAGDKVCLDKNYVDKYIPIMRQNCLRLTRLINNMIDTTKIDGGFFEINLKNYDIIQVIEEITLSVADYIKGKNIELLFDTEIEEKLISCDADKIERIMLNLLSNAVKFTEEGGRIYVNIYDKSDSILISVKDTGIGIPDDKIGLIFDRFKQVDKSLTRNHEGSGIGLSLVKSFVEMHRGKISVSSVYKKGSEFTVELPARRIAVSHNEEKEGYLYDHNEYVRKINIEFSDIYSLNI